MLVKTTEKSLENHEGTSDEEDTGWIVHVWLWCVEVGVSAEQLWNKRQHQRWVTRTQELKTPEHRKKTIRISRTRQW